MTQFFEANEGVVTVLLSIVVAVSVLTTALVKIWPFLSRLVEMVNGFVGYGDEPGVLERVKQLEVNSDAETVNHNNMSAQLDRVETQVHILGGRIDQHTEASTADRQALWQITNTYHGHDKEVDNDEPKNP